MNITEGGNSNKKRAESSLEIWYKSWLNLELAKKPQTWNQPIFWYSGKNEEENKEKPEIHTQKNQLIKNNFAVYAAKKNGFEYTENRSDFDEWKENSTSPPYLKR